MRHADIKVRPVLFGTVCYGAQVQVYLKKNNNNNNINTQNGCCQLMPSKKQKKTNINCINAQI